MAAAVVSDRWTKEARGGVGRAGQGGPPPERCRAVAAQRRTLRQEILDARAAISTLRDELLSASRTNADPALATCSGRQRYMTDLRRELGQAEARLLDLRDRRLDLTREWRSIRGRPPHPA